MKKLLKRITKLKRGTAQLTEVERNLLKEIHTLTRRVEQLEEQSDAER